MDFEQKLTSGEESVKISGRAKAVVKDVVELKSLKMILKMASNCGASRFIFLKKELLVQTSPIC